MPSYVPFSALKERDKNRIRRRDIYPHRTPGYGITRYLYPVDRGGDLIGRRRILRR